VAAPIHVRAEAALGLLKQDPSLDCSLLLSYVVWPSQRLAEARWNKRRPVDRAELERMQELAAQGFSHRKIAGEIGRPRATVTLALARSSRPGSSPS
jgi:hypothetical protein